MEYKIREKLFGANKASAIGTSLTLNDTIKYPINKLTIDGVCKQETTQGKQLFNYEDTTMVTDGITVDEDGWITATFDNTNGTGYKYLNFYTNNLNLKNSTTYAIVSEIKSVSGTGFLIPVSKTNTTPQTGGQFNSEVSYNFATLTNNMIKIETPTTINDFSTTNYGLRTLLQFAKGQSGSITFRLSVLEDTSVTADTFVYEKFTGGQPSPSPDYPQEIKTIENSLKITSCGKNLVNPTTATFTRNGVTFTKNEDGTYTLNGTSTTSFDNNIINLDNKIKVNKNKFYRLSLKVFSGTCTGGNLATNVKLILNNNSIWAWLKSNDIAKQPTDNGYIQFVNLYVANNTTFSDYRVGIQLEVVENSSSPSTDYEPYQGSSLNITIPENEFVGKINETYKDTLKVEYNEEDGQYHLILKKMINRITITSDNVNSFEMLINKNQAVPALTMPKSKLGLPRTWSTYIALVNRYKEITSNSDVKSGTFATNFQISYLWLFDDRFTDLEIAKSLVIGTEIYNILATPYELDLGIVDTLLSYDKITNIFTDSDLYPVINVKYYNGSLDISNYEFSIKEV